MNGTFNRITRLALSLLGGLCFAVASFSTLAAPASQISVTVNPTTGYFESTSRTIVPPTNATISPVKDVSATVVSRLPNGALAQPISNGIEITALKQQQLVKSNVVAKPSALRRAGASCFKGAKCNAALFVGALGLEYLFDSLDWIMGEGGQLQKKGSIGSGSNVNIPESYSFYEGNQVGNFGPSWQPPALSQGEPVLLSCHPVGGGNSSCAWCPSIAQDMGLKGWNIPNYYSGSGRCYYGAGSPVLPDTAPVDLSHQEIDSGFASYQPMPEDWRFLIPGINLSDPDIDIEITDAPRLTTPPVTTTHYDAAGNPVTVSETNTWYDFAPKNNPSKQPELEAQKTETKTEYDAGGNPKGSTTTTIVNPPSSAPQLPETPIDCDLMPTLCEWMLWTKEPPPEGDEADLDDIRQVIDLRDYQQSVTIGPSTIACPEPYQIEIGFIGRSVGVSFQPFCDLADYVRPLLLMFAYFFGAYLTIRSI